MTPLFSRLRWTTRAVVALLAFFVLAGATYQGVATALERHRFQRPGGLVDAGGHQLHIFCMGQGSPVVLLEAAAGSMSVAWGWIQPEIARMTRVCSYDRAGLGLERGWRWSTTSPRGCLRNFGYCWIAPTRTVPSSWLGTRLAHCSLECTRRASLPNTAALVLSRRSDHSADIEWLHVRLVVAVAGTGRYPSPVRGPVIAGDGTAWRFRRGDAGVPESARPPHAGSNGVVHPE